MRTSSLHFMTLAIGAALIATLVAAIPVHAQNPSPNEVIVQLMPADRSAARAANMGTPHVRPANNAAGQALRARQIAEGGTIDRGPLSNGSSGGHAAGIIFQYPGDVGSWGGESSDVRRFTRGIPAAPNRQPMHDLDFPGFSGHVVVFVRLFRIPQDLRRLDDYAGALDCRKSQCS